MTSRLRKRILLLILPLIGGSIIGSIVATEYNGKIGSLKFQHSLKEQLDQFINSSSHNGDTKHLTPVSLITNLAKNPSSVPLLMRGFATQIAKSIFDESLYTKTKYAQVGKSLANHLKVLKAQTNGQISAKRKSAKRVKREWISDEEKYLSNLREFILGKIDLSSIDSYYQLKDHQFSSISTITGKALPFIGFLMAVWTSKYKAGHYVHEIIPYADKFQDSTKNLYSEKFKNINLPEKPDFHFPDFDPSKVEAFQQAIDLWSGGSKSWLDLIGPNKNNQKKVKEELKKKSTIQFISSSNTAQKNLALSYLTQTSSSEHDSSESSGGFSKIFTSLYKSFARNIFKSREDACKASNVGEGYEITKLSDLFLDLKKDPLKLFCITKNSSASAEFLIHRSSKDEKSKQNRIIFWRDDQGFNLFFPVKLEGGQKASELSKSKSSLIDEFKAYIKSNFSYLLLKYYLLIKGCLNGEKGEGTCCCTEIIKNLVAIWELSKKLTELNDNLKVWDNRNKNNSNLKMIDYSRGNNYLSKLGTISPNPPSFLKKLNYQADIKTISSSIKKHLSKIEEYFDCKKKEKNGSTLEAKQVSGEGENKDNKYWTFNGDKKKKEKKECMKRDVAEFLLEKIHSFYLLKKYLLLPISFDNIMQVYSNGTSTSSASNGDKVEQILSENYKKFFNLSAGGGRRKRETPTTSSNKLIDLLSKAIEREVIVSKLNNISDSFLYKLSAEESGSSGAKGSSSSKSEVIKDWLTMSNLLNKPLQAESTLEKSQLRILITSLYLLENSLKEYRELLRNIVKSEFFGSYAYSLSWNKFCTQKDETNPIDPIKGQGNGNGTTSFWTPINSSKDKKQETTEWDASNLDSRRCIRNVDRYSVSSIKKTSSGTETTANGQNIEMMGYKGSLTRGSQLQLPRDLYEKILDFLLKEGYIKWQNIESQVDLIKTNRQFADFITQLTKTKSSIGQAFELPDYKKLKEDLDDSKRVEALEWFGLDKKKELLKEFIKKHLFGNGSGGFVQTSSSTSTNGTNGNDKNSFQGLMWDDSKKENKTLKNYIFSTKEQNEGSAAVYLIQFTEEDLKDENSFLTFINSKLTPDMLIQDIVKKAQDVGLQSKAINHFLMRGTWSTGDKVFTLSSSDYYLKDQFSSIIL